MSLFALKSISAAFQFRELNKIGEEERAGGMPPFIPNMVEDDQGGLCFADGYKVGKYSSIQRCRKG